jgi:glutathione S-transferase
MVFFTPGTCALACIAALEWRGQPFDACLIEPAERSLPGYRAIHPRGMVPALRVGADVLTEVNAIVTHVADSAPSLELLPANGTWARDVANQWLSDFASGVHPVFWPYYHPERWTADPSGIDGVKRAAVESIGRVFARLDAHLAANEFVLGARRSALDPYLYAMARWGNDMLDLNSYPQVMRHLRATALDPAVRVALAVERGRDAGAGARGLRRTLTFADLATKGDFGA